MAVFVGLLAVNNLCIASTVFPLQASKLSIRVVLSNFGKSFASMFKSSILLLDFSSAFVGSSSLSSVISFGSMVFRVVLSSDLFSI